MKGNRGKSGPPNLQRPRAQDARLLVLGHEGRRGALVVGDLLVLVRLVAALAVVSGRVGVARAADDDLVLLVLVVLRAVRLALVLGRAPRPFVLVGRLLRLRLVVLVRVLLEGGLVAAVGGGVKRKQEKNEGGGHAANAYMLSRSSSPKSDMVSKGD